MAAAFSVRSVIHLKNAIPRPVPNNTAALVTWIALSKR